MSDASNLQLLVAEPLLQTLPPTRSLLAWHAALCEEISAHLSSWHGMLLARPEMHDGKVAWLATGRESRPYDSFDAADRDRLLRAAGAILSDIRRLAESGASPIVREAWPSLRDVPDYAHVFAVDGRPVFAGWGHGGSPALRHELIRLDDGVAWRPPARWDWPVTRGALLGLALAIVIVAIGAMTDGGMIATLPACVPAPGDLALQAAQRRAEARHDDLAAQLAGLVQEQGRRQLSCPIPGSKATPHVDLPQQRWQNRDLSMLDGCWDIEGEPKFHHINDDGSLTPEVAVKERRLCFDRTGHGQQTIDLSDGTKCGGPLSAQFAPDGTVHIEEPDNCNGTTRKLREEASCTRQEEGTAICMFHEVEHHPGPKYKPPPDRSEMFHRASSSPDPG